MEVKKIVEGMTAPQVAEIIDSNFKALDLEKADKEETKTSLDSLNSRMFAVDLVGDNNNYKTFSFENIVAGHTYRIWLANPNIDMSGVSSSSENVRFGIVSDDENGVRTRHVVKYVGESLGSNYLITIPEREGLYTLVFGFRATVGKVLKVFIEDITEFNNVYKEVWTSNGTKYYPKERKIYFGSLFYVKNEGGKYKQLDINAEFDFSENYRSGFIVWRVSTNEILYINSNESNKIKHEDIVLLYYFGSANTFTTGALHSDFIRKSFGKEQAAVYLSSGTSYDLDNFKMYLNSIIIVEATGGPYKSYGINKTIEFSKMDGTYVLFNRTDNSVREVTSGHSEEIGDNDIILGYFNRELRRFQNGVLLLDFLSKQEYKKKTLVGVSFSILGDSISTFAGYIPDGFLTYYPNGDVDSYEKTYWGKLINEEGMVLEMNSSWSGSSVGIPSADREDRIPFCNEERWGILKDPDVIIVFGGTNDFGSSKNPLGNYDYSGEYEDLKQFSVAYAFLLSKLKQKYSKSKIVCCTIPTRKGSYIQSGLYPIKQASVRSDVDNRTTHYMFEFNNKIRELATNYECSVCELSDVFNFYDMERMTVDGVLHPNELGHSLIKEKLADSILNILE